LSMSEVIDLDHINMQIHNASERAESDTFGKNVKVNATTSNEFSSADAAGDSLSEQEDKGVVKAAVSAVASSD